jgi:FkbM family methyltransferase
MLISPLELRRVYGVEARGILHVGANEAEESEAYRANSWGPVIWVEMLPEKFWRLKERFAGDPENTVLHAACWDVNDVELPIFRASNDQSSSLLPPDLHLTAHPDVSFSKDVSILTSRLDSILPKSASFDFINFDIQGAELHALRGLGDLLNGVRWAYLEVNKRRVYTGCALLTEIDAFMRERRFIRIATRMVGNSGWGDALYVNTGTLSPATLRWLRLKAALWGVWVDGRQRARFYASKVNHKLMLVASKVKKARSGMIC